MSHEMVPAGGDDDGVPTDHGHPGWLLLQALGAFVECSVQFGGQPSLWTLCWSA